MFVLRSRFDSNAFIGPADVIKPRKHEQRLLRNVGVHTVVLDLLQIPYDEKDDYRMNELMRLAHEFLQNFCLGNQQNQILLHKQLDLFLNPGVSISRYTYHYYYLKRPAFSTMTDSGSGNRLRHLQGQSKPVQRG